MLSSRETKALKFEFRLFVRLMLTSTHSEITENSDAIQKSMKQFSKFTFYRQLFTHSVIFTDLNIYFFSSWIA